MPRILFIAPYILPVGRTAEAMVNAKLVMAALNAGWQMDVIGEDKHTSSWYPDDDRMGCALSDVVSLIRIPERPSLRHFLLRVESHLMFDGMQSLYGNAWAALALRKGRKLMAAKPYDFIMSRALPEYAHLPALILARKTGLPWIANWNDPASLSLLPPPYGNGPYGRPPGGLIMGGLRHLSMKRFFSAVVKEATWHTFPCERLRTYMGQILGEEIFRKSSIIPHVAGDAVAGESGDESGVFSLCYAGSLLHRNPDVFMEGLRRFLDSVQPEKRINVTFVGAHLDNLHKSMVSFGLADIVHIEPGMPYQSALQRLRRASVVLIIEAQMEEGIFLPSKVVDYAQIGRPILAVSPLNGTLADLIGESGGGIVADCFSPESVAAALGCLYASWQTCSLDLEYGSQRLAERFSPKNVIAAYEELFAMILRSKR